MCAVNFLALNYRLLSYVHCLMCQLTEVFNYILITVTHAHRRRGAAALRRRGAAALRRRGVEDISWLGSSQSTGAWLRSESSRERGGTEHTRGGREGLVSTSVSGGDG